MTDVEFHTGLQDPLVFACRLLRKAVRQGLRVQVTAQPETLAALDRALWTFDERDFVPHARVAAASPATLRRSPLLLSTQALADGEAPAVLVNLDAEAPDDATLGRLQRLVEIVGRDEVQAQAGRQRWRAYKARGLEIAHRTAPEGAGRG
jgi:DNA polymerase III subunit chi